MLADWRRQITGFLFAGDFFGLACNSRYSYSVEAVTDVDLCRIPRTKIIQKFHEMPTLGQKVFELTRTELQSAQEQMLLLGRKTAKEKLCSFLLAMHQKPKLIEGMLDNQVYLPMSRSDIADYLGLTIETVSRQFTLLSKDGVIELDGNSIATILSQERLCSIAACE